MDLSTNLKTYQSLCPIHSNSLIKYFASSVSYIF